MTTANTAFKVYADKLNESGDIREREMDKLISDYMNLRINEDTYSVGMDFAAEDHNRRCNDAHAEYLVARAAKLESI